MKHGKKGSKLNKINNFLNNCSGEALFLKSFERKFFTM